MRIKTVGRVLVGAGAAIGIATITAIATGYEIRLSPEMIQLLTYKAFGAAALGLIIVGSWIGRGGSEKHRNATAIENERDFLTQGPAANALPPGASREIHRRSDDRDIATVRGHDQ